MIDRPLLARLWLTAGLAISLCVLMESKFAQAGVEWAETVTEDRELVEAIKNLAQKNSTEDKFSGVVLVAHEGKVLFQEAYGLADRERGLKNTTVTRFNIASVGKMFTGAAIAKLVEQGKLNYDDPIGRHLPDFPIEEARSKVAIHHLLTHTSGLGEHITAEFIKAGPLQLKDYAPFLPTKLDFEPGSKRAYSNAAFVVLGLIIEKVTGTDFYEFVKKEVFTPAGISNSDYFDKLDSSTPNVAIGYTKETGTAESAKEWRSNFDFLVRKGDPAGGAYATAGDLLRFLEALRTGRVISPTAAITMTTPRSGMQSAYGIAELKFDTDRLVGHSGGTEGASADAYIYWNSGYAIIVLSNFDPPASHEIASLARRHLEKRFKS